VNGGWSTARRVRGRVAREEPEAARFPGAGEDTNDSGSAQDGASLLRVAMK